MVNTISNSRTVAQETRDRAKTLFEGLHQKSAHIFARSNTDDRQKFIKLEQDIINHYNEQVAEVEGSGQPISIEQANSLLSTLELLMAIYKSAEHEQNSMSTYGKPV